MRIDKFLNAVNLTKRRTVAQDMISNGVVLINGKVVKASKNVEVGGRQIPLSRNKKAELAEALSNV